MRSVRRIGVVAAFVLLAACPPKTKKTVESPPPPPPPPPPKGDLLRLKDTPGDTPKAKVKLVIEQETPGKKGKTVQVGLGFDFADEEKVDAAADGPLVHSRFVDAIGKPIVGAKQEAVDLFAAILCELKISFKRTPRGEVQALTVAGARDSLNEPTAKVVVGTIHGVQRGAFLPEGHVEPGATWKVEAPLPGNFSGATAFTYTYAKKEGTIATINGEGIVDGKGGSGPNAQKMTGRNTTEVKLDIPTGKILSQTFDTEVKIEKAATGDLVLKQRVRSEWTADGSVK
jgi:hypothetical protein